MAAGLSVTDLTVRFDALTAVDGVTLDLPPGHVLAVLGPSGCGKSTLLRAVAGLEQVAAGSVSYDGHDLAGRAHPQAWLRADVPGRAALPAPVGGRQRRLPAAAARACPGHGSGTASASCSSSSGCRATPTGRRPPCPGGERQRVALARALAVEPRLLLLDEPLSALDRGLRERLAADLRGILTAAGTTALLVTHDQEEAFAVADRMAVMRAGRLVQSGTVADVWRAPVDGEVAAFLGYATVLEGEAAIRVLAAGGRPDAPAAAVALRRSALRCADHGPLRGRVLAARVTPEVTRLVVDVDGVGEVHAVADQDSPVRVGHEVALAVDLSRAAVLPT